MSKNSHMKAVSIIFLSTIVIISSSVETTSVGGKIFKAIKNDSSEDMACSLEDPNEILNVRSKPECILQCQGDPSCSGVNWKEPGTCEVYVFNPETFGTVTRCTFFSSDNKFDILFMCHVVAI